MLLKNAPSLNIPFDGVDISGYSAASEGYILSIKPQRASSKVKAQFMVKYTCSDSVDNRLNLGVAYTTDGTNYTFLGQDLLLGSYNSGGPLNNTYTFNFLHSPNTTNDVSYVMFYQPDGSSFTSPAGLIADASSANCIILEEYNENQSGAVGFTGPSGPTGVSPNVYLQYVYKNSDQLGGNDLNFSPVGSDISASNYFIDISMNSISNKVLTQF